MRTTAVRTDVESFAVLEPTVDGFRNYIRPGPPPPSRPLQPPRSVPGSCDPGRRP